MKAEDVARCWNVARDGASSHTLNFREQLERFASFVASEERAAVVALAKEKAVALVRFECPTCCGEGYDDEKEDGDDTCEKCEGSGEAWLAQPINWSAFDAAVKERSDGGTQ